MPRDKQPRSRQRHHRTGTEADVDLGIAGEVALVLGGSKGLGFSCAQELARAGVRVAINGRNKSDGAAALAKLGKDAIFVQGDVSEPGRVAAIIDEVEKTLGPIHILVTNAGGPPPGQFHEHVIEVWRRALDVNMLSAVEAVQRVLPGMKAAKFGRIVNITSFVVKEPYPNMALANSIRVALTGAMSTLAREVAGEGITVNNILPGLMDTGALQRVIDARVKKQNSTEGRVRDDMAASIPMGRLGEADDFGPLCAFLCSRRAAYNIAVDGGLVRGLI
jgi:3-oxoacyl-[acyl-carrier protein] reductase